MVGLALYLLLSHSGPLGGLGLLFTPSAMVIAQTVLALPIVTALAHRAGEEYWAVYGDALMDLGASEGALVPAVIAMSRAPMVTAVLAGFGRTIFEGPGAIIVVGGNIAALHTDDDDRDRARNRAWERFAAGAGFGISS